MRRGESAHIHMGARRESAKRRTVFRCLGVGVAVLCVIILGTQAREAVGYRELLDHLEGRCTIEEATERIKIRTRRYGKQQRTWLRRFAAIPGTVRLDPTDRSAREVADALVETLEFGAEPS